MSHSLPLLTLREEFDRAIDAVTVALVQAGLRVARSFDVDASACAPPHLPCPHHETTPCACQLTMLLVSHNGPPVVLAAHGDRGHTSFSLVEASPPANPQLEQIVTQMLTPQTFLHLSNGQMTHSNHTTRVT
ncbi:MAG TPA: hypothetical protein VIK33_03230 [Anaerolineae bacterium]